MSDAPATPARFRLLVRVLVLSIAFLVICELFMQLASLLVTKRPNVWRPSASVRILSVGDSHTYGAGLPGDQSYPAHLQKLLDEAAPGAFSVINLGLPGMSTTQVRNRLARNTARYQPDLVIVWCGVNNVWNYSETLEDGWREQLAAFAYHSRLYRLVHVFLHNREIERDAEVIRNEGHHQPWERTVTMGEEQTFEFREGDKIKTYTGQPQLEAWELRRGDSLETIHQVHGPRREDAAMEERTYQDLMAMMAWLDRAGISAVLVRYPQNFTFFARTNKAILRAAADADVPVVDASIGMRRIPSDERNWLPAHHPDGDMYREIAREIVPVVLEISGWQAPAT
jgi:lysophospholipase L1-like esterase